MAMCVTHAPVAAAEIGEKAPATSVGAGYLVDRCVMRVNQALTCRAWERTGVPSEALA